MAHDLGLGIQVRRYCYRSWFLPFRAAEANTAIFQTARRVRRYFAQKLSERYLSERYLSERYLSERYLSERYLSERYLSERY